MKSASVKRVVYVLLTLSLAFLVNLPAFAHHLEDCKSHRLTFDPVLNSPSPEAEGMGKIKLVKRASGGTSETAVFNTNFHFMDLEPNTFYTVAVRGAFSADPNTYGAICSFVSSHHGNGKCRNQVTGLQRLQVAQLRLGDENGMPVLQATREGFGPGPGLIESLGCREEGEEASEQ